jgi:hypothetical protein
MSCCDKYYSNRNFSFCPECGKPIVRSGSRPGYKTDMFRYSYAAQPPKESGRITRRRSISR